MVELSNNPSEEREMMQQLELKECEFCGSETYETFTVKNDYAEKKTAGELCEVCASTWAGNAFLFPSQYDTKIFKQLSQIANFMLKKLSNNQ